MTKTERLEARVDKNVKQTIEEAARLTGMSLTNFIISASTTAAHRTLESHRQISLDAERSKVFVEALLNPPKPASSLHKAAARHRKLVQG